MIVTKIFFSFIKIEMEITFKSKSIVVKNEIKQHDSAEPLPSI